VARSAAAAVRPLAQPPAQLWVLTGEHTGAATTVIGGAIISTTGAMAVAGSARQADGRIQCRIDTAIDRIISIYHPNLKAVATQKL